jgi:hypothetical protein
MGGLKTGKVETLLDILVDLKSAKPHGRSLFHASTRLPVIWRQTLSPMGSAHCLQRHCIREEAPLATLANLSIGFPPKPLSIQLVRAPKPLSIRLVRALEGSEARAPTAGATGVDQKATAAEETPLHYTDRRHRLHQLRPARWIPPLPGIRSN